MPVIIVFLFVIIAFGESPHKKKEKEVISYIVDKYNIEAADLKIKYSHFYNGGCCAQTDDYVIFLYKNKKEFKVIRKHGSIEWTDNFEYDEIN